MKLFLVVMLAAGVAKGGKLYVKAAGANLSSSADGTGKKTALKAGDEVTWNGADAKSPSMQAVDASGKRGFVHQSALTPFKPTEEIGIGAKPIEPRGKSSAQTLAALKALEASSMAAKQKVPAHVKEQGLGAAK